VRCVGMEAARGKAITRGNCLKAFVECIRDATRSPLRDNRRPFPPSPVGLGTPDVLQIKSPTHGRVGFDTRVGGYARTREARTRVRLGAAPQGW